jgi:hypothetical protein
LTNADDVLALHHDLLDTSAYPTRDSLGLDPILLEHEANRLLDIHEPPVRHRSPTRRNLSPSIALRSMRAAAAVAASSSASQLIGSQSPSTRARTSRVRY